MFCPGATAQHLEPFYSSASNQIKRSFDWEDDIFTEEETPSGLNIHLEKLYAMNKIIAEVMDSKDGTLEEKKAIMAEARVTRAMTHFVFINTYAKPYNAATAYSDAGFPILTSSNLTQNHFERKSVGEVYDFILTELKDALPELSEVVTNRMRVSKAAGAAYIGKVLVNMGQYSEAANYLEDAIEYTQNAAVPVNLIDYNTAFLPGGIFEISFFGPTEIVMYDNQEAINLLVHNVSGQNYFLQPNYYISTAVQAEFGPTDQRVNFMIDRNFSPATPFPGGLKRTYTRSSSNHFGASLSDIYLLLAECYARTDRMTEARDTFQYFREHRMSAADAAVDPNITKNDLIRAIIQDRKLEFLGMGDRFQTIRRLYADPLFPELANIKHQVYDTDGTLKNEIDFPAKRIMLRLPLKMVLQNPNMEQNP